VIGVAAALAAAALWAVFLFRNPYAAPAQGVELLFGVMILGASSLAAIAAALGAHLAMYLLFFVLFVPAGFSVLQSSGMFQAIGWLDVVYLGAAALVHRAVSRR
jgi:putative effector of murein hydrolase LrgA (UPF0299 family)